MLRRHQREVPVRQLVEDLASRGDRAAQAHQLPLEREQTLQRPLGGLADDVVLERVDLVLDGVHHREVAVDDPVREGVEQEVRAAPEQASRIPAQLAESERVPPGLVDREEGSRAEDDVHLDLGHLSGERDPEHDDVDRPFDLLDLRPLVALLDVLRDEGVELQELGDVRRLGMGRGRDVHPEASLRIREDRDQLGLALELPHLAVGQGEPTDERIADDRGRGSDRGVGGRLRSGVNGPGTRVRARVRRLHRLLVLRRGPGPAPLSRAYAAAGPAAGRAERPGP